MPYTPPAQLSPASSVSSSPSPSQSSSCQPDQSNHQRSTSISASRNTPPRSLSSSYLTMHRRSPSALKLPLSNSFDERYPNSKSGKVTELNFDPHGSVRQSSPPINDSSIPTGVVSPPESSNTSSDDEEINGDRGRELENLAELQAAIRTIEQKKEGSRERNSEVPYKARVALDIIIPEAHRFQEPQNTPSNARRPPLSKEARKISHSRSSTDSNIILDITHQTRAPVAMSCARSESMSDDEDSEGARDRSRPPMVRKKSGELVRPALRPSSCSRRPSSMPGTPTYSKAVHFDAHLEHVRHFLQVDKPLAVSAGSSPVETYQGEMEFPFGLDESRRRRTSSQGWEIQLPNFHPETPERKNMPVRVERVCLSSDNNNLVGTVAVQNLSYRKQVTARFTLDHWKTTSEVAAEYNNDIRRMHAKDGCDRFNFSIKLSDQANLERKTMFFCVRYDVNGHQYWDSNGSTNYQVDFIRKPKAESGNGATDLDTWPLNSLPGSSLSLPQSTGTRRHQSLPYLFDDFVAGFETYGPYNPSPTSGSGDSPIKLRGARSSDEIVPDAPARRSKANGPAFGSRYDFGASLSAVIQNASTASSEQSGFLKKAGKEQPSRTTSSRESLQSGPVPSKSLDVVINEPVRGAKASPLHALAPTKPAALLSAKPSLQSRTYQELVDKYCFFGSAKTSPKPNQSAPSWVDGTNEENAPVHCDDMGSDPSSPADSTASSSEVSEPSQDAIPPVPRPSSPTTKAGADPRPRDSSPVSFHYPFRQSLNRGFHDAQTPTAILG